jgi:fucose permease
VSVVAAEWCLVFWGADFLENAVGLPEATAATLLTVFWLAGRAWLNVAGLFVVGLGFSNLFPLAMSATVGAAPEQANAASARISLGAGLAILIVPLTLGGFADQVGIFNAYGLVAVLLVVATSLALLANRLGGARRR